MTRLVHLATSDDFLGYIAGTLRFLARMGFEVHVGSTRGAWMNRLEAEGAITGHELPFVRTIDARADAVALARTLRLLSVTQPELLHVHNPKAGLVGLVAGALLGLPRRIYTVHGLPYVTARGARRVAYREAERLSVSLAHRVLAVSDSVQQRLLDDGLVGAERVAVLRRGSAEGVDSAAPRASLASAAQFRESVGVPPDAAVVLFVGRLHREKGLRELVAAWQQISGAHPEAHLVLVGALDPTDPADLSQLPEGCRIHLAGYLDDPGPAYRAASLLVLPSHREGLPTVVLEAALYGVPTLATSALGVVDAIVDGETGALVPVSDVPALAARLAWLLSSPHELERLGARAREFVAAHFDHTHLREALLAEYLSLGVSP